MIRHFKVCSVLDAKCVLSKSGKTPSVCRINGSKKEVCPAAHDSEPASDHHQTAIVIIRQGLWPNSNGSSFRVGAVGSNPEWASFGARIRQLYPWRSGAPADVVGSYRRPTTIRYTCTTKLIRFSADPFSHTSCTCIIIGCLRRTRWLLIPSSFPQGLCRLVSVIGCARRPPIELSSHKFRLAKHLRAARRLVCLGLPCRAGRCGDPRNKISPATAFSYQS
jgi:hypothetical protein